nr:MAG TPA: hypothetical protein [Caudoviricetes sp.]
MLPWRCYYGCVVSKFQLRLNQKLKIKTLKNIKRADREDK